MNKQAKTSVLAACSGLLLLLAGLAVPVSAGELEGVVQHYDPVRHTLDIAGQRYQLTPEAEAEFLQAQPGVGGFIGQKIEYSATEWSSGEWRIEQLNLID